MTCRRADATAAAAADDDDDDDHHADHTTHQHTSCARSPSVSPHAAAVAAPRIWSIVELIQSDNDD